MSAINHSQSNSSPYSRTLPPTTTLARPPHLPLNLPSPSVRSITPAVSSVFRKSLRCAISGPNSPKPPAYEACSRGLPSSLSLWLLCAMRRTEGPSVLARSKHTRINLPYPLVPRFPPISRSPSSLSLRRSHISRVAPIAALFFGR